MAEYHQNFLHAALAFGERLFEESGMRDVWDEIARMNDKGWDVSQFMRSSMGTVGQLASVPLQSFSLGATEVNRGLGALSLQTMKDPSSLVTHPGLGLIGSSIASSQGPTAPWMNFATGGATDEERKVAPGIYKAPSFGDLMVITADKMRQEGVPDWAVSAFGGAYGASYQMGTAFSEGQFKNGSFIPPAFDIYSPDVGEQIDNSDLQFASVLSDLSTEMVVDPLNYAAPWVGAAIKARKVTSIYAKGNEAFTDVAQLLGDSRKQNILRRAMQFPTGMGRIDQGEMLRSLGEGGSRYKMAQDLANNTSISRAESFFRKSVKDGDTASELARMSVLLQTPEQQMHLLNAAAFRNRESISILRTSLAEHTPASNSFDSLLNLDDNLFDRALVEIPNGAEIPDGHILRMSAQQFLDDAIKANPEIQTKWDALAEDVRAGAINEFGQRATKQKQGWETLNQMFPEEGRADSMLASLPSERRVSRATRILKEGEDVEWLARGRIASHFVPGSMHRFRPAFMLMAKPGLTFKLHGTDAIDRVDQMIKYANGLIGSGRGGGVIGNKGRLAADYQFALDPETQRIRSAFIDAGSSTTNPEQLRAALIDELQTHVLSKIAESSGVDYEVARMLAEAGMSKSKTMMSALLSTEKGYMTVIHENGMATVLAGHPTTVRQTANFVPIMDWAGVRKALHSPDMRALADPEGLVSVTKEDVGQLMEDYTGALHGERGLDRFGRTTSKHPVGAVTHAIIDISDTVNNLFKASVLLRLGYPVRNLAEGNLAAVGSGVGWLQLLAHADIEHLIANHAYNWKTMFGRKADRFMTWSGLTKNEVLLSSALEKATKDVQFSHDHIASLLRTVSHDDTYRALARIIADPESTEVQVANATDAIGYLLRRKKELAVHVEDGSVDAQGAVRLFHADNTGALAQRQNYYADDINDINGSLNRPIRMTPFSEVAKAHTDNAWTAYNRGEGNPVSWADRKFEGSHFNVSFTDKDGRLGLLRKPTDRDPNMFDTMPINEVTARSKSSAPYIWVYDEATDSYRKARAAEMKVFEDGRRVESHDLTLNRTQGKYTQPKEPWKDGTAHAQWNEANDELQALSATHRVQMRDGDAPWTTYRRRNYTRGVSENVEFRVLPREVQPKVVSINSWGKEIDLRPGAAGHAEISGFTNIDQQMIDGALAGDPKMVDRLSEALAKQKIYRTILPDSEQWGGVQVVVHPKGIGGRGLRDAVQEDIDRMVKEELDALGPAEVDAVLPHPIKATKMHRQNVKVLNKGQAHKRLGVAVHPEYSTKLRDILQNGGFDAIMEDAVSTHAQLLRRENALRAAYQTRLAKVEKLTKKRGMRDSQYGFASRYGGAYITNSMLSGFDGHAYRDFAAADMTTASTFGGSIHRADLMNNLRTSFLVPTTVTPSDPHYFDALSNLLGRFYRDMPGIEDSLATGARLTLDDVDPIVRMALQNGDRERLYEGAVEWALGTTDGQNWVKTMGLNTPPSGTTADAIETAKKVHAARGEPMVPDRNVNQARREKVAEQDWRDGSHTGNVEVGDVIARQFDFVDNFMLQNPQIRDLFLNGEASAKNLRAAYDAAPWDLKPFHGALSPTSAEYRAMKAAEHTNRTAAAQLSANINEAMSRALRGLSSGPETRLLRHPMFEAVGRLDLQQRISQSEAMLGRPLSLAEINDLRSRSQAFALKKVKETLYTLEQRSTLDDYLRFVSPFFPAYMNALSRWGKFYMQNPAMPAKIWNRVQTVSPLIVDENGMPIEADDQKGTDGYMVLPTGVGKIPGLDKLVPGAAAAMNQTFIPLRSFDVIFQGDVLNPGFGPFVAVPMQELLTKYQTWYEGPVKRWIVDKILPIGPTNTGSHSADAIQQFLPSGIRRLWDATLKTDAYMAQYNKMRILLLTQQRDGTYTGSGDLDADATKLTQLMQFTKFASAFASPLAQQQRGDFEWYSGVFRELRDVTGDTDKAEEAFLEMFPAQFLISQGSTENLTGGASTSNTRENQKRYNEVEQMAASLGDPSLLAFSDNYQPDGTVKPFSSDDYNPYARRAQFLDSPSGFTEPYRNAKSAAEVIRQGNISQGWMMYDQIESTIDGRLVSMGYTPLSEEFNNAKAKMMSDAGAGLAQDNPDWGRARGQFDTQKKSRNATFFRGLINDQNWLSGKEDHVVVKSIRSYLDTRDQVRNMIEEENARRIAAGQRGITSSKDNQYGAMLEVAKAQLSAGSDSFKQWANRYFRNDVVSINDVQEEQ